MLATRAYIRQRKDIAVVVTMQAADKPAHATLDYPSADMARRKLESAGWRAVAKPNDAEPDVIAVYE